MNCSADKVRLIAFYLPQFHKEPINDMAWGEGFTEWTNVKKARPLYKGHCQPKVPSSSIGYYDLSSIEIMEKQAELAKKHGIYGFCFWHYWFGNGKVALELPVENYIDENKPDFPFCLGWANHSWKKDTWKAARKRILGECIVKQEYPGEQDYIDHFNHVLRAFKDDRYIRIEGKPLFYIFNPDDIPDLKAFIDLWQKLAKENGLDGIYFIAKGRTYRNNDLKHVFRWKDQFFFYYKKYINAGFDAVNIDSYERAAVCCDGIVVYFLRKLMAYNGLFKLAQKYDYFRYMEKYYSKYDELEKAIPTVVPNFDKTPRVGRGARILDKSTPELFKIFLSKAIKFVECKKEKIVFLQSWNEWGEGNYVEPDEQWGDEYLKQIKRSIIL